MAPTPYKLLLVLLPLVAGGCTWAASGTKVAKNVAVLTSVTQFAILLSTILIGVIGLLFTQQRVDGTASGRADRLGRACLVLLAESLASVVTATLSLQYTALGPVALGLASSLGLGAYITLLGVFLQFSR